MQQTTATHWQYSLYKKQKTCTLLDPADDSITNWHRQFFEEGLCVCEEGLVCGGGGGDQTLYREKKKMHILKSNTNVIWLSGYYTGLRIQRLWVQTSAKTLDSI